MLMINNRFQGASAPKWAKCVVIGLLVLLIPFAIQQGVQYQQLPKTVTIATGKTGGRYRQIIEAVGSTLQKRTGVEVEFVESPGSSDNFRKIVNGEADFALFQPNVLESLREESEVDLSNVRCVASLFPELALVHLDESLDASIFTGDGASKVLHIAAGEVGSGDAITTQYLLKFYGVTDRIHTHFVDYETLLKQLEAHSIDVAVVTTGKNAPIQQDIADLKHMNLVSLPYLDAIVERNPVFKRKTIPAGYFRTSPAYPQEDIHTIGVNAQLITNSSTSAYLVSLVAEIVTDPTFVSNQDLGELQVGGIEYARSDPCVPFHVGALHHYSPELKPWLDPEFISNTESIRSFVVSIGVALFLFIRWWRTKQILKSEHRLDKFMARLLEIEREQIELAEGAVDMTDCDVLEELLDEVTQLRGDAMESFSANELMQDTGTECFIMLSNSISEKINAKLTRMRLRHELVNIQKLNSSQCGE